jgi:hypothetical protein
MTLISISNFFESALLFILATYFFKSFLNSFQYFAWSYFDLYFSMLRRSVSASALQVSCSVRVIFRDESIEWVLDVEFDGHEEGDGVRIITWPSTVAFVEELEVMSNQWRTTDLIEFRMSQITQNSLKYLMNSQ